MKKMYSVTGAAGHLGNTLVRQLAAKGAEVRGLLLPGEQAEAYPTVTYLTGDVRDQDSLRPLFANARDKEIYVLHTAASSTSRTPCPLGCRPSMWAARPMCWRCAANMG